MDEIIAILVYLGQGESGVITSAWALTVVTFADARIGVRIYVKLKVIADTLAKRKAKVQTPPEVITVGGLPLQAVKHNGAAHHYRY